MLIDARSQALANILLKSKNYWYSIKVEIKKFGGFRGKIDFPLTFSKFKYLAQLFEQFIQILITNIFGKKFSIFICWIFLFTYTMHKNNKRTISFLSKKKSKFMFLKFGCAEQGICHVLTKSCPETPKFLNCHPLKECTMSSHNAIFGIKNVTLDKFCTKWIFTYCKLIK